MEKQKKLQYKVVGKTIVAVIGGKKRSITLEKEEKDQLKLQIDSYNERQTKDKLAKILSRFNKKEEDKKMLAKVEKKKVKKEIKQLKSSKAISRKNSEKDTKLVEELAVANDYNSKLVEENKSLAEKNKILEDQLAKAKEVKQSTPVTSPQRRSGEY